MILVVSLFAPTEGRSLLVLASSVANPFIAHMENYPLVADDAEANHCTGPEASPLIN